MSKVVLITGSSAGIGLATAKAFKDHDYTVYASARHLEAVDLLRNQGFESVQLDVTDEKSMVNAVHSIERRHGAVDILVNNAGYGLHGPVEELELEQIRHEFETNVFGLVRMSQLVLPAMRHQGAGRIINIGSVGGLFTAPGASAYHASKYAVESFSDGMRVEVAKFGVQVVLIQPTGVMTDFIYKQVATMPETGSNSPYYAFKENYKRITTALFDGSSAAVVKPEDVAKQVVNVANIRRPNARYKVGISAHIFAVLRNMLSDRMWDDIMARQFMNPPKSTTSSIST